jgi:hypothetical protein
MRHTNTPRFQQKHYEAIAEHIAKQSLNYLDAIRTANLFIPLFKSDNPKFLAWKFLEWSTKGLQRPVTTRETERYDGMGNRLDGLSEEDGAIVDSNGERT